MPGFSKLIRERGVPMRQALKDYPLDKIVIMEEFCSHISKLKPEQVSQYITNFRVYINGYRQRRPRKVS